MSATSSAATRRLRIFCRLAVSDHLYGVTLPVGIGVEGHRHDGQEHQAESAQREPDFGVAVVFGIEDDFHQNHHEKKRNVLEGLEQRAAHVNDADQPQEHRHEVQRRQQENLERVGENWQIRRESGLLVKPNFSAKKKSFSNIM